MNVVVELSASDLRVVAGGGAVTGAAITVVLAGSDTAAALLDAGPARGILVLRGDQVGLIAGRQIGRLPLADGTRVDVRLQAR